MKRYNESLEGIKKLYDSMDNGSEKTRLGGFIDNWEEQKATYEADMAQLTEDQVVKIEFEYDLARIQAEIDELDDNWKYGDYDSKTGAARITKRIRKREELEKQTGHDEVSDDTGYQESYAAIEDLQIELSGAKDDETKKELQDKIAAIVELQTAFQQFRLDGHEVDWERYLASGEASEILHEMQNDFFLTKDELSNLFDVDIDTKPVEQEAEGIFDKFTSNDNTTTIVMDVEAEPEQVMKQLAELQDGEKLVFSAIVNGEVETVEAIKNVNGTIDYYIVGQDEPIQEDTGVYYWYNGQMEPYPRNADEYYWNVWQQDPEDRDAYVRYHAIVSFATASGTGMAKGISEGLSKV